MSAHPRCVVHCLLLLLAGIFFQLSPLPAEDWPQFLGPQRNGISQETGLLKTWPSGGLPVAWRAPAGVGMASVVVQKGQALTMAQRDGQQQLMAWEAKTGKPQWATAIAPAYGNSQGDGPRATPALDERAAYVFTGEGVLAAVQLSDGKLLWKRDVVKQIGGKVADYGMASSPLIVGDLVVVIAGAPQSAVVACRRDTGAVVWGAGKDPAGYSSPALLKVAGQSQIVAFTGASCIGIRPATGKLLWRYPFTTDYRCNTATPISIGSDIFISAGESHGSALLRVTSRGGQYDVEEVWTSFGPRASMKNEWQTSLYLGGKLYGLDNVGSAGPTTHLACIDPATGREVWQQPRFGKSNAIAADGKLIFTTMKGEVVVALASANGYHELGRSKVLRTTRQAPSLSNGMLYVRDDAEVVALDLRP